MFRTRIIGCTVLLTVTAPAFAAENIDQINQLVQADFRALSEDISAAISYKAVIPAVPLGTTGFDLGAEVTATRLQNQGAWDRASSGSAPTTVYIPKLHLHKGLPLGIDLGAFYATVPGSNLDLWGAEVRYALISGGIAQPAVGVRASHTQLKGVDQLDFSTRGLELTISKGFTIITPYAGVGRIWADSEPRNVSNVQAEHFTQGKYYIGANINLGLANIAVEGDRTGEATSYSAKLGFRF